MPSKHTSACLLLNRHGDGPMLESTTLTANNDDEEAESESDDDNDA